MKEIMLDIIKKYIEIYPNEVERLSILKDYIYKFSSEDIIDWNNFDGHIVASGFVYNKDTKKFLVLYHNDMKMYLYPGGHIDKLDINPYKAAIREVKEETGISNLKVLSVSENEIIPFDIDTHIIEYNHRLDLPSHYHFDLRYLFLVDNIDFVKIDEEELSDYKWVSMDELSCDKNYGNIVEKVKKIIN